MLENEFGTSDEDQVVIQILEKGSMQEYEVCIHPARHTHAHAASICCFFFFFFFLHTQRRSIRSGHRPRLDAHPRQLASPAARGLPALAVVMLRRKEEREGLTAADTFPFCSLPNARGRRMTPRANSSRAEGEPDDFASCPHGQVARRWWEYFFFFFIRVRRAVDDVECRGRRVCRENMDTHFGLRTHEFSILARGRP